MIPVADLAECKEVTVADIALIERLDLIAERLKQVADCIRNKER